MSFKIKYTAYLQIGRLLRDEDASVFLNNSTCRPMSGSLANCVSKRMNSEATGRPIPSALMLTY